MLHNLHENQRNQAAVTALETIFQHLSQFIEHEDCGSALMPLLQA
jgi:hypothetical protein